MAGTETDGMNKGIERGIEGLRRALAEMVLAAREMIHRALAEFEEPSEEATEALRAMDVRLNQYELQLDHMCEMLLVLREPYAVDFRFIFGTIKLTRELERIGDEVKFAARWMPALPGPAPDDLQTLAVRAGERFEAATAALAARDARAAHAVIDEAQEVARLEDAVLGRTEDVAVAAIAHAFGRIAARSTNIAENVVYMVSAKDVRHPGARG